MKKTGKNSLKYGNTTDAMICQNNFRILQCYSYYTVSLQKLGL